MARYNKIFAGPATEVTPQVQEAILNGAYVPGTFVVFSSGNFAQAGANALGRVLLLQDNYLLQKAVTDAYASGDRAQALELIDDQLFNALVATGNSLAKGSPLATTASGRLALATTGQRIVAWSEETYNNNTGSDQLVRVRPAKAIGAA
jgi:hypothetical protein